MKEIAIFRNQLFKNSESFITNQAESIKKYNVVYVGRKVVGAKVVEQNVKTIKDADEDGFRAKELWNILSRDPYAYLRLLKESNIELIHAHFAIDALYACEISKKIGVPLVSTLHGFDVTTRNIDFLKSRSPSWINYCFFSHRLKTRGDLFLCVSDFIKKKAIDAGFPESKLLKHYIGIKIDDVCSNEKKEKVILHVARLVEKKGTTYLIDAIKKIENQLDGYIVKIVGNGPLFDELQSKIEVLGLKKHIEMLGEIPHDRVMQLIKTSSILVVPSVTAKSGDSEGLPTVILEASANQVPVIGTLHAGIPEAIVDEITGYIVGERDTDSLSERIKILIQNDIKRESMGVNARKLMCEKFNLDIQTNILENEYDRLINGK
ncbi:TPA: glycosyltransferase [Raoultella planticola]